MKNRIIIRVRRVREIMPTSHGTEIEKKEEVNSVRGRTNKRMLNVLLVIEYRDRKSSALEAKTLFRIPRNDCMTIPRFSNSIKIAMIKAAKVQNPVSRKVSE